MKTKTRVSNYHGISSLGTVYIFVLMAIVQRLEMYAKDVVGKFQCGFKKNKVYNRSYFYIKITYKENNTMSTMGSYTTIIVS